MSANPLSASEVGRYGRILRSFLLSLDRQVVGSAFVGESKTDLLSAVGQEMDGVREFLDRWVGAAPVAADLGGSGLAVLDAFEDQVLSGAKHDDLLLDDGSSNVPESAA